MAGTTISANVTAMSGTSPITYTTTIRKATGYSPTGNDAIVATGSGTGNAVVSHTITTGEASGTPDQFKAYTVGTNAYGNFTVGSNTVISTPYVAPQYTISWSGNGGTVSPTSQLVNSGTTVSAPTPTRSGYTFLYWRDSPSAFSYIYQINPGGSWTVTSNIQFYAYWQAASVPATAPGTPGTPTNGWTGGTAYPFSWSAPSAGTVSGGGAASISYYNLYIYEATNSSGSGYYQINSYTVYGTSFNYTSPNASKYYACQVSATNTAGLTGGLSGFSAYK
jgi:hypothetical protein